MALQTSGQISVGDIITELSGSAGQYTLNDTDFRDLADISSGEIELADFYGKSAVTAIMGASMTAGYSSGQYHTSSGYASAGTGSASNTNCSNHTLMLGQTSGVFCSQAMNTNGTMYLFFQKSGYTGTFFNGGWTSVNFYLDQHTNSGSPDLTILRTAFNYSTSNGNAYYTKYGPYATSSYFGGGGVSLKDYFVEIL